MALLVADFGAWRGLAVDNYEEADVIIKGVPYDGAASMGKGTCEAPKVMRDLSLNLSVMVGAGYTIKNFKVYDDGDFPLNIHIEKYYETITADARRIFEDGKFGMFIGGDHSITIPLQRAFLDVVGGEGKKVGVIHFDAHPDITDVYLGSKYSHGSSNCRNIEHKNMSSKDLAMVGIRCPEPYEMEWTKKHAKDLTIHYADDCFEKGISTVCQELKDKFKDYDAIYLTFDIDALDPAFAPGTGTPEAGGLSTRDGFEFIRFLIKELPVKAMDVVEVSPPLDVPTNITSFAGLKLIYEAFGQLCKKKHGHE